MGQATLINESLDKRPYPMSSDAEKKHYRQDILALTQVITAILNYDGSHSAGGFLFLQHQADNLFRNLKHRLGGKRRIHPKTALKSHHLSRHV